MSSVQIKRDCSQFEGLLFVGSDVISMAEFSGTDRCYRTFRGHLSLYCPLPAAVPIICATLSPINIPAHFILTATISI